MGDEEWEVQASSDGMSKSLVQKVEHKKFSQWHFNSIVW